MLQILVANKANDDTQWKCKEAMTSMSTKSLVASAKTTFSDSLSTKIFKENDGSRSEAMEIIVRCTNFLSQSDQGGTLYIK